MTTRRLSSPTGRRRPWWQRPALRTDEEFEVERPVGWLELFFDLVFVVVISRLAHHLAGHLSVNGVVEFTFQFVAVFWVWNAFTYYTERFESEGLENRLFAFLALLPVAGLAVWAEDGLGANYVGFASAYLLARAVNLGMWARAALHVAAFRPVGVRFVMGFAMVVVLVAASFATQGGMRLTLWTVAVVADIATPYFTMAQQARLPRLSTSKFPHRFGLFTIIVLGESVIGVIAGLSELHEQRLLGVLGIVHGALALAIGFALWWTYFDFIARRPPRPAIATALGWVYLHLAGMTAITMTGVGLSTAIADTAHGTLTRPSRLLLGGAVALALLALGLLETTLARGADEPTHPRLSPGLKLVSGVVVGVVASADLGWTTLGLLAMLLAALLVQVIYGGYVWFTQDIPDTASH